MAKITVIGSSNTDMVVKVPNIPAPGETILGGTFMQAAGGKGANQAVAAARYGGSVSFVACVGQDDLGDAAILGFQKEGIKTNLIQQSTDHPSGVALIMVSAEGENSIAVASGANAALSPAYLNQHPSVIQESGMLLLQLESPLATVEQAVKIASESNVPIILNPAPAQELSDDLLQQITILTPNETEAEILSGIPVKDLAGAKEAAATLLKKGVQQVIITLGSQGVYLHNANQSTFLPAFQVKATDTTGAGDTFNGVLAVSLAEGNSVKVAIQEAQAAAALAVTRMGAQPSIPKREEVKLWLKQMG